MKTSVLIFESGKTWRTRLRQLLGENFRILFKPTIRQLVAVENFRDFAAIILCPEADQYRAIIEFISQHRELTTIILLDNNENSDETIHDFLRAGADFCLQKSELKEDELKLAVKIFSDRRRLLSLSEAPVESQLKKYFYGKSPQARHIEEQIGQLKNLNSHVLLSGETGTGKTEIARRLHFESVRNNHDFMHINCPSIPETLLESELFGFERGAFTGASESKSGKLLAAGEGTIFLDEIGEISNALQSKLLKVIEDGTFYPLGSLRQIKIQARIIAATNKNLEKAVAANLFREDLFYRLNTFHLHLPPLRNRKEDIPELFQFFVTQKCKKYEIDEPEIDLSIYPSLMACDWPGNIRQLENLTESIIVARPQRIDNSILPSNFPELTDNFTVRQNDSVIPLKNFTKMYIDLIVKKLNGNITRAAKLLEVDRKTIRKFIRNGQ